MQQRKLISLPSLDDLKREAERTGFKWSEEVERAYMSAQAQMEMARMRMARAALRVVRPSDFHRIESERRSKVREATYAANVQISAFFEETCTGFLSDDPGFETYKHTTDR